MSTIIEMLDPHGVSFERWSCEMAGRSADVGIYAGAKEADWKKWARNFTGATTVSAQGVPSPDAFHSWREWAQAMMIYQNFTV